MKPLQPAEEFRRNADLATEHLDEAPVTETDRSRNITHGDAGAGRSEHVQRSCRCGMVFCTASMQAARSGTLRGFETFPEASSLRTSARVDHGSMAPRDPPDRRECLRIRLPPHRRNGTAPPGLKCTPTIDSC